MFLQCLGSKITHSFPKEKKDKLIEFAKKKNIKLNFDKYPKYGVPKNIGPKRNPTYTSLINFKNKGFKSCLVQENDF